MSFILSENREKIEEVPAAFRKYHAYLASVRGSFPASAYELASSDWICDPQDHRCPHDTRLEHFLIKEIIGETDKVARTLEISVRLLGAYGDGHLEFHYSNVKGYTVGKVCGNVPDGCKNNGHRDWIYDEFRLSNRGFVLHEIEWENGRWLIEAADVTSKWSPIE